MQIEDEKRNARINLARKSLAEFHLEDQEGNWKIILRWISARSVVELEEVELAQNLLC
jgi:hypothetical protein